MKNTKLLAVIALVAVIGFSFAACDSNGDNNGGEGGAGSGTFTVTNIPSEFNGKYVWFAGMVFDNMYSEVFGAVSDPNNVQFFDKATLPQISNGKVVIPLWIHTNPYTRYSGTGNLSDSNSINICDGPVWYYDSGNVAAYRFYLNNSTVKFTNGSASASLNDATKLF